jgi:hypothetical protein
VLVGLVLWSAPLIDVVLHWPGNVGDVAAYFTSGNHPSVGAAQALRLVAAEFRIVPPWFGGGHSVQPVSWYALPAASGWLLVAVALATAGFIASFVSGRGEDRRMLGLGVLMVATSVIAIAGADEPRAYLFPWRAVVAAFLGVAAASAVVNAFSPRFGRSARLVVAVVAVGVVAWGSIAMTAAVVRRPSVLLTAREPDLEQVMRTLDRDDRLPRTVRLRSTPPPWSSFFDGMVNELDRRGVDVKVEPRLGHVLGEERTVAPSARVPTWFVTETGSEIPGLLARPGARLIVATTPLPAALERELTALQRRIAASLVQAGRSPRHLGLSASVAAPQLAGLPGVSADDLRRLVGLNAMVEASRRCRCAIVEVPR